MDPWAMKGNSSLRGFPFSRMSILLDNAPRLECLFWTLGVTWLRALVE